MVPFLVGTRNLNSILALEESLHFLVKAFYVLTLVLKSGGNLLIVNNKPEFSNILKQTQKRISSSQIAYSDGKWVGGLLTNWKKFKPSALKFINFKYHFNSFLNKETIDLPSYKKWQACFEGLFCKKKYNITSLFIPSKKLNNSIEKNNHDCLSQKKQEHQKHQEVSFLDELVFFKLPTFIFALSPNENQNMLEEAFRLHIPVIAITDSNTDLSLITYPIPANNQSIFFTRLCLNWISRIAQKTLKQTKTKIT